MNIRNLTSPLTNFLSSPLTNFLSSPLTNFLTSLLLLFLTSSPSSAFWGGKIEPDPWFIKLINPYQQKYYAGSRASVFDGGYTLGSIWASTPRWDNGTVTVNYVEMTDVRNSAKLARINAGQLGHYAIGLGFEFTLFGRNGLQPFVGFKSYNLKVGSVYFGAGLFHLSENFLATAQLYYDNLLENTILAVSFSI